MSDIQSKIDALPKLHKPMPYVVRINTRKTGDYLHTLHVRASSEQRARYTALKTEREVFNRKQTSIGNARLATPGDFL
jgi:hypothetical protein